MKHLRKFFLPFLVLSTIPLFTGCATVTGPGGQEPGQSFFDSEIGQYVKTRGEVVGTELGVEAVTRNNPELVSLANKIAKVLENAEPEKVTRDELRAEIKGLIAGEIDDLETRRWALRIVDEAGELSRLLIRIDDAPDGRKALYKRLAQAIRNGATNGALSAQSP